VLWLRLVFPLGLSLNATGGLIKLPLNLVLVILSPLRLFARNINKV